MGNGRLGMVSVAVVAMLLGGCGDDEIVPQEMPTENIGERSSDEPAPMDPDGVDGS